MSLVTARPVAAAVKQADQLVIMLLFPEMHRVIDHLQKCAYEAALLSSVVKSKQLWELLPRITAPRPPNQQARPYGTGL